MPSTSSISKKTDSVLGPGTFKVDLNIRTDRVIGPDLSDTPDIG